MCNIKRYANNFFCLLLVGILIFTSLLIIPTVSAEETASEDVLYNEEVGTKTKTQCNNMWHSNTDKYYKLSQKMDGEITKQSFMWSNLFKQDSADGKGLEYGEPLCVEIKDLNIDLNEYNDTRLIIDYLCCHSHVSLIKTDSLQIFVIGSDSQTYGPFGLYYWEFTGLYERTSGTIKYYERNFNLISDKITVPDGVVINQINILPYGDYPQYVDEEISFKGDWRVTGAFNVSGFKLIGYKNSEYKKPSYVETETFD